MQPRTGGNGERSARAGSAAADRATVNCGVLAESTAHPLIDIDRQDLARLGHCERVAADPGHKSTTSGQTNRLGLVSGNPFRGRLFDPRRLDPHFHGRAELDAGLDAAPVTIGSLRSPPRGRHVFRNLARSAGPIDRISATSARS